MSGERRPELSVVVPLFNEEANLPELYRRTAAALDDLGVSYELILVNDGSRDGTADLADGLARRDGRVAALHLSRNFGHQAAICAGLDHARGRAVVLMDGDLQDPPELVARFLDAWRDGADVVYAVRARRREGPLKRAAYALFYRLWRAVSDLDVPLDSGDFCLMDRKVVAALRALPERQRFVRGLRAFVGFRQVGVPYDRDARFAGAPKYTFRGLCRLAVDGLVSFSGLPLTLITYVGLAALALALGVAGWALWGAWHTPAAQGGWAGTLAAVLFMGAVQLVSLGALGEYVRRIFLEVKRRPTYLVARRVGAARRRRRSPPTPPPAPYNDRVAGRSFT
jgi:dolichol-phosphate mannosyltransferase